MAEKSSVTPWPPCETRSEACSARWAAASSSAPPPRL